MAKFINEFVYGILAFQYGFTDIAIFNNNVTFTTPSGIRSALIQEIPNGATDWFHYNSDTLSDKPTVFQFTDAYVRIFKIKDIQELINDNEESIVIDNEFSVLPYIAVKHKVVEILFQENSGTIIDNKTFKK